MTELLVILCSRRKVAWSEISTSAQKKFLCSIRTNIASLINTGFSDFSEEAESSDAGTDDDEACGVDERASVISRGDSLDGSEESEDGDRGSDDDEACGVDERASVISRTDSLDGSEESEDGDGGSDHDDASREDERASVVLIHQSHDNTARHGENNSRPGSPIYHLSGPVISRSFPDNNSESSVRGDPPRSFALVLHDGEVSPPMYDPPTVNPAQLTLHNVRYSGSNIEESTFEAPNLNMAQNVERDENLTRSMGMSVKDLVENVSDHHQQGMYYMVPPTSSTSHPAHWRESSSNINLNLDQSMQPVPSGRTSTNIDNTPHFAQSLQPAIPSKRNHRTMTSSNISPPADFIQLPPTQKMICEIKKFFTDAMGRGLSNHPTKGIAGVKPGDLATIYRAIYHPTAPLRLIPDGPSESGSDSSAAGPSRKRRWGDSDDGISRPKHHHGVPMHFDRSSDS
ncbi:hypothetical protein C8J56DRAFT_944622 [Mycena floridula]|nr:hypothetical protein C8J56DRAFT_944622 [Mycena floridula]